MTTATALRVYRTIKLGTKRTVSDLEVAMEGTGRILWRYDGTRYVLHLPEFVLEPQEVEIDLVMVCAHELGLCGEPTLLDLYNKVKEFGLELCPLEVGPQLRLQDLDQNYGSVYYVATTHKSTFYSGVLHTLFLLRHFDLDQLHLQKESLGPTRKIGLFTYFVFIRPRK
jgi:hypothetical protein